MEFLYPRVSVIIPFFNTGAFLREAVESVLAQDFTDWELLLVDDGSHDNSRHIALQYAEAHPTRIFYLEHPGHVNRGVCASRNLGVKQARAEWIALLDADDVWLPQKLSSQIKIVEQNPEVAMVLEASRYWHSWTESLEADAVVHVGKELEGILQPPFLLKSLYPFGKYAAPCPSAILFKKEICLQTGGFEEAFHGYYQLYEDQAFLCKFYLDYPVYLSKECNNLYRQREGSCVQSTLAAGKYKMVRKYFLDFFSSYLTKKQNSDPLVHALLRKAYLPYGSGLKNKMERLVQKASDKIEHYLS